MHFTDALYLLQEENIPPSSPPELWQSQIYFVGNVRHALKERVSREEFGDMLSPISVKYRVSKMALPAF